MRNPATSEDHHLISLKRYNKRNAGTPNHTVAPAEKVKIIGNRPMTGVREVSPMMVTIITGIIEAIKNPIILAVTFFTDDIL